MEQTIVDAIHNEKPWNIMNGLYEYFALVLGD